MSSLTGSPFDPNRPGGPGTPTPVSVQTPTSFLLPNPYETVPAGMNQAYFATAATALVMAALVPGGVPRFETSGGVSGGMEGVWMIDYPNAIPHKITWNAGDLYRYYQQHPTYMVLQSS